MSHLYKPRSIEAQSFLNVKKTVVPNQSMTLRDIIRRFIRKESLPVMRDGVYEDRYGDLEKMAQQDITVQMDIAADLKAKIDKGQKAAAKRKADADKKAADDAAAAQAAQIPPIVPGGGEPPLKSPDPKGP